MKAFDTIVVGVGSMGSATVYELAKRGQRVLGLEQYDVPNTLGSSVGVNRIIRLAYAEHPDYVPLLRRAYERWRDIERTSRERLLISPPLVGPLPNSIRLKQVAAANTDPANAGAPPEWAPLPASPAIPGVIAAGQNWKVVWSWEGNNTDGIIAGDNGTMLFANNDASNVMKMDLATGLATILYRNTNTGGSLSRSKNGALFVAQR